MEISIEVSSEMYVYVLLLWPSEGQLKHIPGDGFIKIPSLLRYGTL